MNKIKISVLIVIGILIISCNKKSKEETTVISKDVKETFQKYAHETKGVLGKNLMNAINTQGTEKAIEFCSTKAIVLTDSMGTAFNVTLKRVSDKPRNPLNMANNNETAFINELKEKISKGEKMTPMLLRQSFEELGTTYIKIGQFIASTPSIYPREYVTVFQGCLDQTTPMPYSYIEGVLRKELEKDGQTLEDIFQNHQGSSSLFCFL